MTQLINEPLGTVAYNGHTFNGSSASKMSCRMVSDRAGRTTVYVEYELTIREIIVPDGMNSTGQIGTDHAMNDIRNQLTARGQRLQFSAVGFGDFDINGATAVQDIAYGPHPEVLEMTPLGAGNAWALLWRCLTRIPQCATAVFTNRIMAQNFDLEIRQDKHGFTTRTITGYYEIPAQRNGSNITDTADDYWESVLANIPRLPGFEREWTRKMSLDKRTMDVSIVDTQKSVTGFQFGCTDWEGDMDVLILRGGPVAQVNLSASYEVDNTQPKKVALERFGTLLVSRVLAGAPFGSLAKFFPLEWRVREQLHGRRVSCSLTYQISSDPTTILAATGIFAPIPNSDQNTWPTTVAQAIGPRGTANLVYDPSSDAIVDLCTPTTVTIRGGGGPPERELRSQENFMATKPPPNESYLFYEISLRVIGNTNLFFSKPMTRDLRTSDYQQNEMRAGDPNNVPQGGGRLENQIENSPVDPDMVQATVTADYYILVEGRALRVGYPVPFPNLLALGNVPCYLITTDCQTGVAMNAGIPMHWATFYLLYRCPSKPTASAPTPNPVLRTTDPT